MTEIVPYVQMYRAGLAPEGRPAGVFLLLGPTGTGKTRTVEALAEVLHGTEKHLLRVDCGEFQMEHEVAKLIGAPPGYLGHRETPAMLTQQKLGAVTSESSNLALILFDEIEKAAPSMTRLLLGVLDKALLRLGDNTSVNFERTLIFLTSNLGAQAMRKELLPDFGFETMVAVPAEGSVRKLEGIGLRAVKRKFSPEFVNRIDAVITYQPLDADSLELILGQQIAILERHLRDRLQERAFDLEIELEARQFLLEKGTSREYGARELKRTILRQLTQPLAAMMESRKIPPGALVRASYNGTSAKLTLEVEKEEADSD
jgi:ATP-dependent Clp protease ATP-binding subunit ClpA